MRSRREDSGRMRILTALFLFAAISSAQVFLPAQSAQAATVDVKLAGGIAWGASGLSTVVVQGYTCPYCATAGELSDLVFMTQVLDGALSWEHPVSRRVKYLTLKYQQLQHTKCVDALLTSYAQDPSASPAPTGNLSQNTVYRDANPINIMVVNSSDPGSVSGTIAQAWGATGSDKFVTANGAAYYDAVFPNIGTGDLAAIQFFRQPKYQSETIYAVLMSATNSSSLVPDVLLAFEQTTVALGESATGNSTMRALSTSQVQVLVSAMASQSEGYHPSSCYQ